MPWARARFSMRPVCISTISWSDTQFTSIPSTFFDFPRFSSLTYFSIDASILSNASFVGVVPMRSSTHFIYLFIQVYCPYATLGYERPTPHL
jgi:hypothetical protein